MNGENSWVSGNQRTSGANDHTVLMEKHLDQYVESVGVKSWGDLSDYLHDLFLRDSWVFRGQSASSWSLQPSLERHANGAVPPKDAERMLLKTFKRRAHQYLVHLPEVDDEVGWLALMQHHGVPTRLLDWTRSPYVALYFAMEAPVNDTCALWIVNHAVFKSVAFNKVQDAQVEDQKTGEIPRDLLGNDESLASPSRFRRFFMDDPLRVVAPIQPHWVDERLTIQQGLFLCAGDTALTFEQNLLLTLRYGEMYIDGFADSKSLVKLVIPGRLRPEVLRELRRMNVTSANLFPGLDGFSRSLATELAIIGATAPEHRFMDGDAIDQM